MTGTEWRIRPGSQGDRQLLATFACADSAIWWQAEVEQFIQTQLIDWAFDPHTADGDPPRPVPSARASRGDEQPRPQLSEADD
jgi:hypothetical protein